MGRARTRLRARRQERGYTQESFAEAIRASVAAVQDWEQGRRVPQPDNRRAMCDVLDVTPAGLALLLDQPAAPNGHDVPSWLGHLASLEQAAAKIWAWEPVVVHGLLQTADYATVVESVGPAPVDADHVAQKVETRIARQAVLARATDPLYLSVVLDESVLHRVAGNKEVMAAQLDHLAEVSGMPNVEVQVLPLADGVFSAAFGSFWIFASDDNPQPFMVVTEDRAGPHYLDRPPDLASHVNLFEHLSDVALNVEQSRNLICTIAQEKYQ